MLQGVDVPITAPNISRAAKFPEDQDTHLRYLCAKVMAIDIYTDAICDAVDELQLDDPRWEAAYAESHSMMEDFHALVEQIGALQAYSLKAREAKGRVVQVYLRNDSNSSAIALSYAHDELAASVAA